MTKVPQAPSPSTDEDTLSRLTIVARRLEAPTHPMSASLIDHWQARASGGRLPLRREIACRALVHHLPFLHLHEAVDAAGTDWRCRLVGSAIGERYGVTDARGKTLAETCSPEVAERRSERYRLVCETGQPVIARGRIMNIGRDFYEIEVIHLPVEAHHGAPCVLGGMFFF